MTIASSRSVVTPLFESARRPTQRRPVSAPSLDALRRALVRVSSPHSACNVERVSRMVKTLAEEGHLDLPLPGSGNTLERFMAFTEIGAVDLSLARLSEGHADAHAILREASREPIANALYGVWAAEPPHARVIARRSGDGWILSGRKQFASGARLVQRALVTAKAPDGDRLFDVDLSQRNVHRLLGTWPAVGMAASDSLEIEFANVVVDDGAAIGKPGYYVKRAGFRHGAIGVAACWLGGAVGALRMLERRFEDFTPDDHQAAHYGFVIATCASMSAMLASAAREIDADPTDEFSNAQERALVVRQVIEEGCQKVLERTGRASGTGPLVFDEEHARRVADLLVYLRQHHAERDLAELGRLSLAKNGMGST